MKRTQPALQAQWSRRERDIVYKYDRKTSGHLLHSAFAGLLQELDRRGYDLTTLRFSIRLKSEIDTADNPEPKECKP